MSAAAKGPTKAELERELARARVELTDAKSRTDAFIEGLQRAEAALAEKNRELERALREEHAAKARIAELEKNLEAAKAKAAELELELAPHRAPRPKPASGHQQFLENVPPPDPTDYPHEVLKAPHHKGGSK